MKIIATIVVAALAVTACGGDKRKHNDETPPADDGTDDGAELDGADKGADKSEKEPNVADVPHNDAMANFRGFIATNDIIAQRMVAPGTMFYLGRYLDNYSRTQLYGLPQLLGYDSGGGLRAEFRNGKANAINMVLWHLTLSSFARDVAYHCVDANLSLPLAVQLNEGAAQAVKAACAWPAATARDGATLQTLWRVVMGYDAPATEFAAFLAFFQGADWDAATGRDAVEAMMTAMLMNPHFIVRK